MRNVADRNLARVGALFGLLQTCTLLCDLGMPVGMDALAAICPGLPTTGFRDRHWFRNYCRLFFSEGAGVPGFPFTRRRRVPRVGRIVCVANHGICGSQGGPPTLSPPALPIACNRRL